MTALDETTTVRVCMYCGYCEYSALATGPAFEVAEFLRKIAIAHVAEFHPGKIPAGDMDLLVLEDLGFR